MSNTKNKLRQKINERCPHLLELSFGCEVEFAGHIGSICQVGTTFTRVRFVKDEFSDTLKIEGLKILGHPPTYTDLLMALGKYYCLCGDHLSKIEWKNSVGYYLGEKVCDLDLSIPLLDNPDEILEKVLALF